MKVSTTISGIILFLFLYYFFIYTPRSAEDDIKNLTEEEKKKYKETHEKLTPHEKDILEHPDYWANPINTFMYDLLNK